MADGRGDLQLSWATVVGGAAICISLAGAGWTIFQNEFSSVKDVATADRNQSLLYYNTNRDDLIRSSTELKDRLNGLESQLRIIAPRLAHEPVEQKTIDAINTATDKRIDLIQAQITDINRQIAAALIIIDNNNATPRRNSPALPP